MVIIIYLIGVAVVILAIKKTSYSDKTISGMLAFLWLWAGIVFFIIFFSPIFPLYSLFGALFILQGLIFLVFGIYKPSLSFKIEGNKYSLVGTIFIIYALVIYPLIGYFTGHSYPSGPIFGAPCPICIFTFGLLLGTNKRISLFVLVIPLIWSLTGIYAVTTFHVWADIGEVVVGVAGTLMILYRNRTER